MLEFFLALVAFLPIGVFLFMKYFMHWHDREIILVDLAIVAASAYAFWNVDIAQIIASALQGFLWGFEIIYIVLAGIFFSRAVAQSNVLTVIRTWFKQISPDRRVQAILISWFLGSALDTLIGFSPTSGITCGIMAGIGFPPACAAMVAIMGIIASNAFCSAGAPMVLAMNHGLSDLSFAQRLTAAGYNLDEYIHLVSGKVAIIHGIAGTFLPLMIVMMMSRFFGKNRNWTDGLSIAPFAIFAGLAFTVPYALTALSFGPEFPSIVGGLVGLAITVTAARLGFLIPKDQWEFPPQNEWRQDWAVGKFNPSPTEWMPLWKTLLPFTLLTVLVFLTRWPSLGMPQFLKSCALNLPNFLGTSVTVSFETLFNHGTILFFGFFVCMFFYHHVMQHTMAAVTPNFVIVIAMIMRLPLLLAVVSIYFNSGVNGSGYLNMPEMLAQGITQIPGASFIAPFVSPFIGAFVTHCFDTHAFSNVIASNFQFYLGEYSISSGTLFLALQMVGSSVGNLATIHYLAGTGVTVGLLGWEAPTGRRLAIPLFVYLIFTGLIGMAMAHIWKFPDPLHLNF